MISLPKINNSPTPGPKILLAPLDWGLGHATRCIPIIKELLKQKCEVWIAASGDQKALLQEEFPLLPFVELPGYDIKYGKSRAFTLLKIVGSIPKILIRIKREKAWLRQFLAVEKPNAVISDNRYGLYAPGLYSVFITHQLRIRTPFGRWADRLLQWIHYRAIRRFSCCWIPDFEGSNSLAGNLSHPDNLPVIPTRYIGLLSRLESPPFSGPEKLSRPAEAPAPCDLLVLLSGPEPQRTIFEEKVLAQLSSFSGRAILVRGLPVPGTSPGSSGGTGSAFPVNAGTTSLAGAGAVIPPGVRVYNHLPAGILSIVVYEAGFVLSRAGYSTIMDLVKLGKKAILVPTPGQTEQEYLGSYLSGKGIALCMEQSAFSLSLAMDRARDFPFIGIGASGTALDGAPDSGGMASVENDLLQRALDSFLQSIRSGPFSK